MQGFFLSALFLCLQLCVAYVLVCVTNDLIKPENIQQRGLGNIRVELRHRAPTVSPRFIYIQQYTGPQPTPKHVYANHSRHAKLNLTQSACVHECVFGCMWAEEGARFPKNMSSSFSVLSKVLQRLIVRWYNGFVAQNQLCTTIYIYIFFFL